MGFFRARADKGIAWHIEASSVVETLIYHGKLANQIARLAAIKHIFPRADKGRSRERKNLLTPSASTSGILSTRTYTEFDCAALLAVL